MIPPSDLTHLREAYLKAYDDNGKDVAGRRIAKTYLDGSTGIYHGEVTKIGFIPKIFDMKALRQMDTFAKMTYQILEKVTQHYLDDPGYRSLFGFSPLLERLICLPTGYPCLIPIMRMDIFLDETRMDFSFCEFNTDGTSAMNEDREGANSLCLTPTFQRVRDRLDLRPQELFEGWVDGFLDIYHSSEQAADHGSCAPDNPDELGAVSPSAAARIAIVDYAQSSTPYEFEEFRRRFEARGVSCMICDIPELEYHEGTLYGIDLDDQRRRAGKQSIQAVYRRAVTREIVEELGEELGYDPYPHASFKDDTDSIRGNPAGTIQAGNIGNADVTLSGAHALVKAVEDKRVCMIGGFVTHVAHSKQVFSVLHMPETEAFLNAEENDFIKSHVPYTTRLDASNIDLELIKAHKEEWIIKPDDGYASQGVFAGIDYDRGDWEKLVDDCSEKRYVAQAYCPQYATPNVCTNPSPGVSTDLSPWNNMIGLFMYQGEFSGMFSRAGQKGIIVSFAGGMTVPNFLSQYEPGAGLALRTRPVFTQEP